MPAEDQAAPSVFEAFEPALRESDAQLPELADEVMPQSVVTKAPGRRGERPKDPGAEVSRREGLPTDMDRDRVLFAFGVPDKARVKGLAAKSGLPMRSGTELERRKQAGRKTITEDADKRRKVEAIFAKAELTEQGQNHAEGAQEDPVNRPPGAEII